MTLFVARLDSLYPFEHSSDIFEGLDRSKYPDEVLNSNLIFTSHLLIDSLESRSAVELFKLDAKSTIAIPLRISLELYVLVVYVSDYNTLISTVHRLESITNDFNSFPYRELPSTFKQLKDCTKESTVLRKKVLSNLHDIKVSNNKLLTVQVYLPYTNYLNIRIIRVLIDILSSPVLFIRYNQLALTGIADLRLHLPKLSFPIG